jgi:hypothetical protein
VRRAIPVVELRALPVERRQPVENTDTPIIDALAPGLRHRADRWRTSQSAYDWLVMIAWNELLSGALGGLVGGGVVAGASRIWTRNDARRDHYANALAAWLTLNKARAVADDQQRDADERAVTEQAWMNIDSPPVSTAYKKLREAKNDADKTSALDEYVKAAQAYTRWTLIKRLTLWCKG